MLGLILVVFGSTLLVANPPRTATYSRSVTIPYTVFEELSPGWHNHTILYTAGAGELHVKMPGGNITKININTLEAENCVHRKLTLHVSSEGVFEAVDGEHVYMTLIAEQGHRTILLDSIDVVIKASSLMPTGTPYTVTLRPGETTSSPSELLTSYEVRGTKGLLYASVYKPSENTVKILIGADPIPVPLNATAILLKVNGSARGELHVWMRVRYPCTITYYLDKPLYKPHISYQKIVVKDHYLELGSLIPAIILANNKTRINASLLLPTST